VQVHTTGVMRRGNEIALGVGHGALPNIETRCCLHIRERTLRGDFDRARRSKFCARGGLGVESMWSPNPTENAPGVQMESKSLSRKSRVFIDGCL